MISSRCKIKFPIGDKSGVELSEIRKQIKKEIEAAKFFGKPLVNVWINEEETEAGSSTLWEACIKQASSCDIFISLLDGEAGWQKDDSGIGICHAEFETAYANSPGKVREISLIGDIGKSKPKTRADLDFLNAVSRAAILEARNFQGVADLKERTKEMVHELILQLAHEGAREVKRSGPNTGQALDWSRLNFADRQKEMIDVLVTSLSEKKKNQNSWRLSRGACFGYSGTVLSIRDTGSIFGFCCKGIGGPTVSTRSRAFRFTGVRYWWSGACNCLPKECD